MNDAIRAGAAPQPDSNSEIKARTGVFSSVLGTAPLKLTTPLIDSHRRSSAYIPAAGLVEAVDVAMLLGQPILLTGDPGVGKTRAAHWLAEQLGGKKLMRYDVKSTTTGTDLLYHFDEVSRFRDATRDPSRKAERPLVRYLRFNALGEAILRAAGGDAILRTTTGVELTGEGFEQNFDLLVEAFGREALNGLSAAPVSLLLPDEVSFPKAAPEHRVVLIDELDKAPRDTPNDLLAEIDEMQFAIRELGLVVGATDRGFRPVVIITSNSEKSLSDPFLRRCAYFDIPFPVRYEKTDKKLAWPGKGTLDEILQGRIENLRGGGRLVQEALDLFQQFRDESSGIRKRPGTAELLAWVDILVHRYELKAEDELRSATRDGMIKETLGAVLKNKEDMDAALRILKRWIDGKPKPT